jgi:hypothetical protein
MNEIVKRNALGHPVAGGPSLNPGGRPRGAIQEVRELLGPHTPKFVAALVELAQSPNDTTRLAAIREALDRLLAKAPVAVDDNEAEARAREAIGQLYLTAVQAANRPADLIDVTPELDAPAGDECNRTTEW